MSLRVPEKPLMSTAPPIFERPGRVLIVEPQVSLREMLREMLAHDGYECVLLEDGDDLLRLYAEFKPDLLLIAFTLPNSSGPELCGDVRASDPFHHVPTILLGHGADDQAAAGGLLAGADDFVSDVTRVAELRARVHVQLRNKRLFDTLQRVRSERDLLRHDVQVDALTGLLNRRALESAVRERCSASERFGVLFMDLDHFKLINDRFGHGIGDRVLIAVSHVLRSALRPGDVVARYGGEEFVALISGAGPESARLVAERLRRSLEQMPAVHRGPERVTVSVGVAVFDPQKRDEAPLELLRRADVALYAAKRSGRNRVVSAGVDDASSELQSLPPGEAGARSPSPPSPPSEVNSR